MIQEIIDDEVVDITEVALSYVVLPNVGKLSAMSRAEAEVLIQKSIESIADQLRLSTGKELVIEYDTEALLATIFVEEEDSSEAPEVHEHDYVAVVIIEPTCTEGGLVVYTCECGESYEDDVAATGHNGVWEIVKPADYSVEGCRVRFHLWSTCSGRRHPHYHEICKGG